LGEGYRYEWTPLTWIDDSAAAKPKVDPDQTTYYKVLATSPDNCTVEDSIKITVVQRVFMADAFTPNNDGINDTWPIIGIESYPDIDVKIFNRWGNIVYHAVGSSQKPFDGTFKGEPLPEGVYVYVVRAKPDGHIDRGQVMITR
jgi:gliding motility-associated-like protein